MKFLIVVAVIGIVLTVTDHLVGVRVGIIQTSVYLLMGGVIREFAGK